PVPPAGQQESAQDQLQRAGLVPPAVVDAAEVAAEQPPAGRGEVGEVGRQRRAGEAEHARQPDRHPAQATPPGGHAAAATRTSGSAGTAAGAGSGSADGSRASPASSSS